MNRTTLALALWILSVILAVSGLVLLFVNIRFLFLNLGSMIVNLAARALGGRELESKLRRGYRRVFRR
jgi:hypothetical protein